MKSKHLIAIAVLVCLFTAARADFVFAQALTKAPVKKVILSDINNKSGKGSSAPHSAPSNIPQILPSTTHMHSLGIGLGQTFLSGGFGENGEDRITVDLIYSYSASYSFDLLADVHYSKHKSKNESISLLGTSLSIKSKLYQFDSLAPFILGGLGFYRPQSKRNVNGKLVKSEAKMTFGTNVGAGVDLRLNQSYTAGVLAHYHNPFDVKQDEGPEVEGSYFKLLLTLTRSF